MVFDWFGVVNACFGVVLGWCGWQLGGIGVVSGWFGCNRNKEINVRICKKVAYAKTEAQISFAVT